MPSPNNVLTADSYVQDGLVFQLDGIEYGGIDGQWIDRKQNIIFTPTDGDNRQMNSFRFDSNVYMTSEQAVPYLACPTIEATIRGYLGGNTPIFYFNYNLKFFTVAQNNCFAFGRRTKLSSSGLACITARYVNLVKNGKIVDIFQDGNIGISTSKPTIGRLRDIDIYKGSIYAIRIYSRQLSDREILINQKIDNARFGLGLDIPDEVLPASRSLSLLEPFELPDESESQLEPTNDNSDER